MILGYLTLITALSISAVAIYYSVAGLVAIFAAAAVPIMIMGGILEVGKLVTAVWLHRYWEQSKWWLKTYLSVAVVVLMFITSMGIFGFLSKAHIEQTSASQESVARVETIQKEIDRQTAIVTRAENEINKLESTGTGSDANVQSQIDKEQQRIDSAYSRIQPAIDEQNAIINSQGQLLRDELARIDAGLATLQRYIDEGDIKRAQQMVGARADGSFGPNTATKFREWQDAQQLKRTELLTEIQKSTNNPQARAASAEIKRIRAGVELQIAQSNTLINRLRTQIGKTDNTANIQASIDEQNTRIQQSNLQIDTLTEERIALESEYRKLEAEVGPIKYIAEFIYGETDTNTLEEAVRWVIIIIIFVFDPLAVLLLIAAQYTFEFRKKELEDDRGERLRLEREEYERARAQRIVDNPGFAPYNPVPTGDNNPTNSVFVEQEEEVEDEASDRLDDEQSNRAEEETAGGTAGGDLSEFRDAGRDAASADESTRAELSRGDTSDGVALADEDILGDTIEKKDLRSPVELDREAEYDAKEQDETFQLNKTSWKEANPDQTLKHYKNLYVKGIIDSLPWEEKTPDDNYNTSEGYQQNAEQSETTLFNKLSKK